MSNIIGTIVGVVFVLLGLILLVAWWSMFLKALMAIIPIFLVLVGASALAYFISEMKSKVEAVQEKSPAPEEKKVGEK